MTLRSFGPIMPLQGFMLQLAGYGPARDVGYRDLVLQENNDDLCVNVQNGLGSLRKATGEDYGYSLHDWHSFLINSPSFSDQYRFPRTWPAVERAILAEIANPKRAVLEESLQQKYGAFQSEK